MIESYIIVIIVIICIIIGIVASIILYKVIKNKVRKGKVKETGLKYQYNTIDDPNSQAELLAEKYENDIYLLNIIKKYPSVAEDSNKEKQEITELYLDNLRSLLNNPRLSIYNRKWMENKIRELQ